MNCFFHDTQPSNRACARCRKQLCEDCYHTTYPNYCWGCGLDFDNKLEESEQGMVLPQWLQGAPAQYAIVKLAAAGGSWIGVTVVGSFVLGLFGALVGFAAVFLAIFSIWVVYTYGLSCAVLVDLAGKFTLKMSNIVRMVVYAVLGAAFPWLTTLFSDGNGLYHHPLNTLFGSVAALLFWGVERLRHKTSLIHALAIVSLIVILIMLAMIINGEMLIWEAGFKGWRRGD